VKDLIIAARQYMNRAFICALASAIPIGLLPFCVEKETTFHQVLSIIVALLFWGCIIVEAICLYKANKLCKLIEKRNSFIPLYKYGVIRFARNKLAKWADLCLGISLILLILIEIIVWQNVWIQTLVTVVFIVSIQFHAILNGEIYLTINKNMHRRKKDVEIFKK